MLVGRAGFALTPGPSPQGSREKPGRFWPLVYCCCWPWYGRAGNSVFPPFSLIPGHFVAVEMLPVVVFAAGEGAFDRLRMSGLALTLRPLSPREEAEVWRVLAVGIL